LHFFEQQPEEQAILLNVNVYKNSLDYKPCEKVCSLLFYAKSYNLFAYNHFYRLGLARTLLHLKGLLAISPKDQTEKNYFSSFNSHFYFP
jgi:hypothetical protein